MCWVHLYCWVASDFLCGNKWPGKKMFDEKSFLPFLCYHQLPPHQSHFRNRRNKQEFHLQDSMLVLEMEFVVWESLVWARAHNYEKRYFLSIAYFCTYSYLLRWITCAKAAYVRACPIEIQQKLERNLHYFNLPGKIF